MPTKEQIWEAIEALAQSLGVAAEYVWEVVMRQQFWVNGWLLIVIGAVLLPFGIWGVQLLWATMGEERSGYKWRSGKVDMSGKQGSYAMLGSFIGFSCLGASLILFIVGVCHIINPGYYALKSIMAMF